MSPSRCVLVLGASGATGRRLVTQLLAWGHAVRVVVRRADRLPPDLRGHANLTLVEGSVLEFDEARLEALVSDCDAIASCLGHNVSLRGLFGPPYRLVRRTVERICRAVAARSPARPVRFVLMSSVAVRNADLDEPVSRGHRFLLGVLRALVPPQADNEQAAEYLRGQVDRENGAVEWVVVRPDSLQEGIGVSGYAVHESPTRSGLFDPGRTRRANVAHFMARLATREDAWRQWRFRMPVLYNQAESFESQRE